MRRIEEPTEWLCTCEREEGEVCKIDDEGRIICKRCGLPIKSQLEMLKKHEDIPWDLGFTLFH